MRRDTQHLVRWRVIWRDKTQTLQQYIRITVKKVQVKCPASRLYPQHFRQSPTVSEDKAILYDVRARDSRGLNTGMYSYF